MSQLLARTPSETARSLAVEHRPRGLTELRDKRSFDRYDTMVFLLPMGLII
jgi:hypothetical protein